jgi:hypothetical protein
MDAFCCCGDAVIVANFSVAIELDRQELWLLV